MPTFPKSARALAILTVVAAAGLSACASRAPTAANVPPFYQRLDVAGRSIDPASSMGMINAWRQKNGLPALSYDPALARVAQAQASAMAAADSPQASLGADQNVTARLSRASYGVRSANENVSAGYRTFAEAFSGWRDSRGHNAIMLDPRATRMGIATALNPASKYQVFWSMVVAEPAN
ncbi:MAG: CAP domain-containing protein [Hyphomicrobiaceae bacterium]|nr:CAP domain-containing protein [Hyphomicrobiaceae bacterium]